MIGACAHIERWSPVAFADPATGESVNSLQRVKYTHDAMIDLVLANPSISQGDIARHFGYTPAWISIIFNSDAFRERMHARKAEIVDPILMTTMEDRLRGLCDKSVEVLMEKLEVQRNPNVAVRVLEHSTRALGYGAQNTKPVQVNTYVALLPAKARDAGEWVAQHSPSIHVDTNVNTCTQVEAAHAPAE